MRSVKISENTWTKSRLNDKALAFQHQTVVSCQNDVTLSSLAVRMQVGHANGLETWHERHSKVLGSRCQHLRLCVVHTDGGWGSGCFHKNGGARGCSVR